ncbi:MAG: type II toxin-antitoxin system VapC family toxin [Rhodoplanes sp.]
MVIDSSALVAILLGEPDRDRLQSAIDADDVRFVSAVAKHEAGMVMVGRLGPQGGIELQNLLTWIGATIVPFDERQADIARDAFLRYGKGRHKAGLNFGDCAAYALAIAEAEPLLFKGTDFAATDVECVPLGEAEGE